MRLFLLLLSLAAGDFAGEFRNAQIALRLEPDGAAWKGTLAVQGKPYPVKGAVKGGSFEGAFTVEGKEFPISATLEGEELVLRNGGRVFRLARVPEAAPQNPLENVPAPQPQPAPPGPPQPPAPPANDVLARLRNPCPAEPDPKREWTILVHLAADNNLEAPGVQDMNEMEAGIPEEGVEVIVLADRAKGFDETDGNWTGGRLYRIRRDADASKLASPVLHDLGEINSGDPAVLEAFVEGGFRAFPSRQRMVVLWNHGGGWGVLCSDDEAPGSAKGTDHLDLFKLRSALERGMKAAGVPKLQIVGFDMCLMGQLEQAVELSDLAEVMVASQAIEPGWGWPYDTVLPQFGRGTLGSRRLGTEIVAAFDAFYDAKKDETTTLSAIDLSLTKEVVASLDRLLGKLRPALAAQWPAASRALYFGQSFSDRSDFRKGPNGLNSLDLLDVLRRLRAGMNPFPAEEEMRDFVAAMDRYVLAAQNNEKYKRSTGLCVYAPVVAPSVHPAYAGTLLAKSGAWAPFLAELHRLQAAETAPPRFSNARLTDAEGKPAERARPLGGARYRFDVEGRNIVWTEFWEGVRDPSGALRVLNKGFVFDPEWMARLARAKELPTHEIDFVMPQYVDGVNHLEEECLGLDLLVTNGAAKTEVMLDASNPDPVTVWRSAALVEHANFGAQPMEAALQFDAVFWDVADLVLRIPQPDGRIALMRVPVDKVPPDAKFTFVHELVLPDGTLALGRGGTLEWRNGLRLVGGVQAPGERGAYFRSQTMGDVSAGQTIWYRIDADPELEKLARSWDNVKPAILAGDWTVSVLVEENGKIEMKPTGISFQVEQNAKAEMLFHAKGKDVDGSPLPQLWLLDLSGLPNVRFADLDANGKIQGAQIAFVLVGEKEGKLRLVARMLGLGQTWVYEKAGGGGPPPVIVDPREEERLKPVEVPDPVPLR